MTFHFSEQGKMISLRQAQSFAFNLTLDVCYKFVFFCCRYVCLFISTARSNNCFENSRYEFFY